MSNNTAQWEKCCSKALKTVRRGKHSPLSNQIAWNEKSVIAATKHVRGSKCGTKTIDEWLQWTIRACLFENVIIALTS